jgi:O-antigen/teichoic acid export membrane protein
MSSKRSLWSRFASNFLGNGYTQLISTLSQFIAVPFYLTQWGHKGYAEWLILFGLPSMLSALDFGVGHASNSKAIIYAAEGRLADTKQSLQTSLVFSLSISAGLFLFALIFSHLTELPNLLRLSTVDHAQASSILLFLTGTLCLTLIGNGPISGYFRVTDRTSTGIFFLGNRHLLDLFIVIFILSNGHGPVSLAAALFFGQAVFLLILVLFLHQTEAKQLIGIRKASWQEFCTTLKPALGYAKITLSQVLTLQGGLQILNQIAPPSIVVAYSMSRTLMRVVMQIGVIASHSLRPELSRLVGKGNESKAKHFNVKISNFTIAISIACYISLILTGPWLVSIWSRHQVSANHGTLAAIGLHALLNAMWYITNTYKTSINQHSKTATIYFTGSILSLCVWPLFSEQIPAIYLASIALAVPEATMWLYIKFTNRNSLSS